MISKKENSNQDEINLLYLIYVIWNYRFIILLIAFIPVILMMGYQKSKDAFEPTYMITTEIRPISNFEDFKYSAYNSYIIKMDSDVLLSKDVFERKKLNNKFENSDNKKKNNINKNSTFESSGLINKELLMNFFLTSINDSSYLKEVIKEFNFLKKEDYESLNSYEKAVEDMSTSIILLSPETIQRNSQNKEFKNPYWVIKFKTKYINRWQEFLKFINEILNKRTQKYLENYYELLFLNQKNLKKLAIEDIDLEIMNTLEIYKTTISRRLIYLEEQAEIARKLDIDKRDLIESQSFRTDTGVFTSLTAEIPYYMRGYEMIEKEIELIKNRTNNKAFAEGIIELEKSKKSLITNKDTERLEFLFNETPIKKDTKNFKAAKIMFESPRIQSLDSQISLRKLLILTFIISLIFAIFFVLILNVLKKRA